MAPYKEGIKKGLGTLRAMTSSWLNPITTQFTNSFVVYALTMSSICSINNRHTYAWLFYFSSYIVFILSNISFAISFKLACNLVCHYFFYLFFCILTTKFVFPFFSIRFRNVKKKQVFSFYDWSYFCCYL